MGGRVYIHLCFADFECHAKLVATLSTALRTKIEPRIARVECRAGDLGGFVSHYLQQRDDIKLLAILRRRKNHELHITPVLSD